MIAEPVLLALIAAAAFGLALVVTQFGLRHVSASDGVLVSIPVTTVLFWAVSPLFFDWGTWNTSAAAIFAAVGLFFPAAVTLLTYEANKRLGPTIAGTIGGTTPLFAAAAATLFLGEQVTARAAIATAAVVAGIVTLSWQPRAGQRWPVHLILLPLAAALLRGLAQATTKLGLEIWPSAFAAGLIGYSISVLSVVADARLRRRHTPVEFNVKGALWFALVGVCNGAAVLSMYGALALGAVTLVAPTVATYPLFTLLLGRLWLAERLTLRAAAGTALSVIGIGGLLLGR